MFRIDFRYMAIRKSTGIISDVHWLLLIITKFTKLKMFKEANCSQDPEIGLPLLVVLSFGHISFHMYKLIFVMLPSKNLPVSFLVFIG